MSQHKEEKDGLKGSNSELIRLILNALKEHEEKMDLDIDKLDLVAENLSLAVDKLSQNLKRISETLCSIEDKINEIKNLNIVR
jgi:hypothetical protein